MVIRFILLACLLVSTYLPAQVRLNEAVSSNGEHQDEDGDTPDWFELMNEGDDLNLEGWSITDDLDEPRKWVVPSINLPSGGHQLIWASDKNRPNGFYFRSLSTPEEECRYLIPSSPMQEHWAELEFDDSAWNVGHMNIGYGDGPYETEVPTGTISVFVRQEFVVADPNGVHALLLDMDFDDGYVAYINGCEVARENLGNGPPKWSDLASSLGEGRIKDGKPPSRYSINEAADYLVEGVNVLAVEVHNVTENSSDLTLTAFLTALVEAGSGVGVSTPSVLNLSNLPPHSNFKLSSRGDDLYLFNPTGTLVDQLAVRDINRNISIGIPPGGGSSKLYEDTTPGHANTSQGYSSKVAQLINFSEPGGVYDSLTLTLSGAAASATIRYTTDATIPDASSEIYGPPLQLRGTTVVRTRIFEENKLPSPVQSMTYIIGESHDLDVVSIVTDPDNLFDQERGIYVTGNEAQSALPFYGANFWRDEEVPVAFSLFPNDDESFRQSVGLKIFGGWSRIQAQRSLSLFARNRYGDGDMDYSFFESRPYDEYKSLVLRNSGNDWMRSMMRDITMTELMDGSGVDVLANRPVVTYLNGQYWGIYNLREKLNEDYIENLHDVPSDSVDILELGGIINEGNNQSYKELLNYVRANDLRDDAAFAKVRDEIDIDNYIKYHLAQIYYGNIDWPANNIRFWRAQRPGAKWRWIMYDTDFSLNISTVNPPSENRIEYAFVEWGPNPPWSTEMMRGLIQNTQFKYQFINQLADEMNSRFLYTNVNELITRNEDRIRSEYERAAQRWGYNDNLQSEVAQMRGYFQARPAFVKDHVLQYFRLNDYYSTTILIEDPSEGSVRVNSLSIEEEEWSGDYFEGVPIQLEAIANEGFAFSHWEIDADAQVEIITVNVDRPMTFRPIFKSTGTSLLPDDDGAGLQFITKLNYSPNPTSELARLAFTSDQGVAMDARLYDARGVEVHSFVMGDIRAGNHAYTADLSGLPTGVYQLRIIENGERNALFSWVIY